MKIRLLILSLFASTFAIADDIRQLAPTVVTATRVETNSFDLPVSIDVVGSESIHDGQAEMNLSESLIRVPGLTAQNRTQMAQDPEIATRGFGARSAFGVRGVRIIYDGIPLSMPDGIGQPGNVDLSTINSIEVMRGPFSSLYGSSSGGIIQLISKDAPKIPQVDFGFMGGSYGTTKETIGASGTLKDIQYSLSADRFDTDGYRDHSSAWKEQQTAKIKFNVTDSMKLTILANHFKSEAEDPLGLGTSDGIDKEKFTRYNSATATAPATTSDVKYDYTSSNNKYYSAFSSPKAAPDVAILANTRVARSNTQVGFNLENKFNENNTIKIIGSVGQRSNLQYLALPLSYGYSKSTYTTYKSFSNIWLADTDTLQSVVDRSKGRASSIERDFLNSEINWTNQGKILTKDYSITTGFAYGWMNDRRKDINASGGEMLSTDSSAYSNPSGVTLNCYAAGTCGSSALTNYQVNMNRDENDTAYNLDQYIQGKLSVLDSTDVHAGIRHSLVNMRFKSNIPTSISPSVNMNGTVTFEDTTSVLGVIWKATPAFNIYANYGQGFETPTLIEMAYNSSTTATGPNLNLKPSTSDNYETGIKASVFGNTMINAALFRVVTRNEIIVSANSAYSQYSNAQRTARNGLEFSIDSRLNHNINLYGSFTYIDAKFESNFASGVGGSNGLGGTVKSGNTIPGTYKEQLYGEISWKYPELNFKTALEGRVNSKVYIDDLNSASAPGYAIANIRAGFEQPVSNWKISEFLRVENIFDKSYIGSVRVNDSNNRNYEPAAGRNYLVGINASYQFK